MVFYKYMRAIPTLHLKVTYLPETIKKAIFPNCPNRESNVVLTTLAALAPAPSYS